MAKTVFITGASTGIGRATATLFQMQGWNVVATMRSPDQAPELARLDRLHCLYLDVTQPESIQQAVNRALEEFQTIDVLVNNAGYALLGTFESCTVEQIQQQFATNVFGLMDVTRALLPHFRQQQSGVIINLSSIGGKLTFPLYSLYHATKWAVEGFSDSLQYELDPFNIRVKLIEPGPIKTDFYGRSADMAKDVDLPDYKAFTDRVLPAINQAGESGAPPEVTAQVIYRAATDGSSRLRYPAGGNAGLLLLMRKLLPDGWFRGLIRSTVLR